MADEDIVREFIYDNTRDDLMPETRQVPVIDALDRLVAENNALRYDVTQLPRDMRKLVAERDEALDRWRNQADLSDKWFARAEAAEAEVARLREAAKLRRMHGHNDTCQSVLETDVQYPCSCGHDALGAALGKEQT
jgi:hypothetical protein